MERNNRKKNDTNQYPKVSDTREHQNNRSDVYQNNRSDVYQNNRSDVYQNNRSDRPQNNRSDRPQNNRSDRPQNNRSDRNYARERRPQSNRSDEHHQSETLDELIKQLAVKKVGGKHSLLRKICKHIMHKMDSSETNELNNNASKDIDKLVDSLKNDEVNIIKKELGPLHENPKDSADQTRNDNFYTIRKEISLRYSKKHENLIPCQKETQISTSESEENKVSIFRNQALENNDSEKQANLRDFQREMEISTNESKENRELKNHIEILESKIEKFKRDEKNRGDERERKAFQIILGTLRSIIIDYIRDDQNKKELLENMKDIGFELIGEYNNEVDWEKNQSAYNLRPHEPKGGDKFICVNPGWRYKDSVILTAEVELSTQDKIQK